MQQEGFLQGGQLHANDAPKNHTKACPESLWMFAHWSLALSALAVVAADLGLLLYARSGRLPAVAPLEVDRVRSLAGDG